ncbi:hypothetical protein BASA83_012985 [Batrachochytrium salamandrivorans]|nr:hypothetical protein BASA83_012985 [Batrachochytrium salamandrivorans]
MSRHSTSSSHGTNDPAISHSMDSDIHELQHSISELLSSIVSHAGMTQDVSDNPTSQRASTGSQRSPTRLISVFERKLKADSYPTEKYVDALTACCHPEEADWVESSITHCQSWDEAKDRFLRHFIDEDMETFQSRPQLETCSSHPLPDKAIRPSQKDVNLVKATRPENVDTVSGIVRTLVTLYPPTKISAKPGSPTQALRWCSYHRSPAHSDEECQAQKRSDFHRPPATAKSGSTSQARRISTWCEHHKVNTPFHQRMQTNKSIPTNATSSRVFPKSMLATSNATYAPTSQRCHKCNEVGHYANRCPKLTNAAPVPTRHSSALVSNQSSNQNGPTTAYQEPEAESKDPTVEDFYELFSKRPSNHLSQSLSEQTGIDYNSAFLVPIIFESVQLSAYIDSGASHSSVPQTLLQQIPHRKFTHKFEISDPPAGVQVIIGRDLFTLLGITISGLPLPQPVNKPAEEELSTAYVHDRRRDRRSSSAVVRLETGDHPPVYRRQYPIPFNVHGQVKEQIEEWVQTGKVTDAPIGCQYNNPLLVVPKKDLEGKLSKVRVCIDPRQLNKQLQADRFPLPLIKDIFSFFANSKIFSTIDLEQAYLQLPILPQHQPKTAFTWGNRHLMFVGTPFGICITASSSNAQCHSCFEDQSALTLFKMTFQSVLSHLNTSEGFSQHHQQVDSSKSPHTTFEMHFFQEKYPLTWPHNVGTESPLTAARYLPLLIGRFPQLVDKLNSTLA